MKNPVPRTTSARPKEDLKTLVSFVILFALYHFAEYMIMFQNNVVGFFSFQVLFFAAAWFLGNWYSKKGLAAWGLPFFIKNFGPFLLGVMFGLILYAVPYWATMSLRIETITTVPELNSIFKSSLPFAFGVFFSSLSEDVLTRGLVFARFSKNLKATGLILLSASIYLLNHIYRLNDGIESLLYIFLLGIVFIIPVLYTKNLWFTGGMHWAGNTFFFVAHNVIQTEENPHNLSSNFVFSIWLALFIPLLWVVTKTYFKPLKNQLFNEN